jgi:ribosome-binding factor A
LTFEYDPTIERGVRLSRLIDELAPGEHDPD